MEELQRILIEAGYAVSNEYAEHGIDQVYISKSVLIVVRAFNDIAAMISTWRRDQSVIASEIQRRLKDPYKWDLYFVLLAPEAITEGTLQAVQDIQNDTFCCRKIIIDSTEAESVERGLGQLPFVMPSQRPEHVVANLRDFFIRQLAQRHIDRQLVEALLGKSADEVAELLIAHVAKQPE